MSYLGVVDGVAVPGADAGRLLLDMSGVSNAVMTDWLIHFKWLAAQQRSWGQLAVRRFGLNLRNVLAASAVSSWPPATGRKRCLRVASVSGPRTA